MATDLERLVLVLEAQTSGIERQLKKFNTSVDKSMSTAAASSRKFDRALQTTRMNTANVAAQFQDIGVQLAGGTSPFLIAIQQGTQLNQVLGPMGVRGAIAALGPALASMVNPVSLATIAFIGLGGTAVQYLTQIWSGTEQTKQSLTDQATLIQQVADRWGDAVPALREYANELRRAQEAADLQRAVQIQQNAALDEVRAILPQVNEQLSQFINQAANSGWGGAMEADANRVATAFDTATAALDQAATAIQNGEDATDELSAANAALADLIANTAIPEVGAMRDALNLLSKAYRTASVEAARLNNQQAAAAAREANKGRFDKTGARLGGGRPNPLDEFNFNRRFGSREGGSNHWEDIFPELFLDETPIRSGGGGGGSGGRSRLSDAIDNATESTKAFEDSQRDAERQAQSLGSALGNAMSGFVNALADGKLEAKEVLGIVAQLVSQLARMPGAGGGFGGGFLSALLGGFGGFFADGGRLGAGKWGIAGEAGVPEIIHGPAQITPVSKLTRSGGGGTTVNYAPVINAPGADAAALARVEQSVRELGRNVPKMAVSAVKTTQNRKTRP